MSDVYKMLNMENFCWSLWENSITRILKVTLDSILTVIVVDKAEDRALNIYLKNNILAIFQCSRSQTSLERQIFNDFDILIILKVRNLVSSPALTLATRIYISITCACFLCNLKIADARNVVFSTGYLLSCWRQYEKKEKSNHGTAEHYCPSFLLIRIKSKSPKIKNQKVGPTLSSLPLATGATQQQPMLWAPHFVWLTVGNADTASNWSSGAIIVDIWKICILQVFKNTDEKFTKEED